MSTSVHELEDNGVAHHSADCAECKPRRRATHAQVVADWHGHAVCLCGTMSPHLTRNHERREWHAEHTVS